jgi:hypothetical protein
MEGWDPQFECDVEWDASRDLCSRRPLKASDDSRSLPTDRKVGHCLFYMDKRHLLNRTWQRKMRGRLHTFAVSDPPSCFAARGCDEHDTRFATASLHEYLCCPPNPTWPRGFSRLRSAGFSRIVLARRNNDEDLERTASQSDDLIPPCPRLSLLLTTHIFFLIIGSFGAGAALLR